MTRFSTMRVCAYCSLYLAIGLLLAFLVACDGAEVVSEAPVTVIAEPSPTPLPAPTREATLMPTATPEPTATPAPTETAMPTETATPAPTESQIALEYLRDDSRFVNLAHGDALASILTFRASEGLQNAFYEKLPPEVQALDPQNQDPLYFLFPDMPKLEEVIGGLSIHVTGQEDKVSLNGMPVVFTILNHDEEIPGVSFAYFASGIEGRGYQYDAFAETNGDSITRVHVVIKMATYPINRFEYGTPHSDTYVGHILGEGLIQGLFKLRGGTTINPDFWNNFYYSDEEISQLPIWLILPRVINPDIENEGGYYSKNLFNKLDIQGQIPLPFKSLLN